MAVSVLPAETTIGSVVIVINTVLSALIEVTTLPWRTPLESTTSTPFNFVLAKKPLLVTVIEVILTSVEPAERLTFNALLKAANLDKRHLFVV
ncbi:MAG: hypothetical protein AABX90_01330, partial [Nanoarchaeota archaeon]